MIRVGRGDTGAGTGWDGRGRAGLRGTCWLQASGLEEACTLPGVSKAARRTTASLLRLRQPLRGVWGEGCSSFQSPPSPLPHTLRTASVHPGCSKSRSNPPKPQQKKKKRERKPGKHESSLAVPNVSVSAPLTVEKKKIKKTARSV